MLLVWFWDSKWNKSTFKGKNSYIVINEQARVNGRSYYDLWCWFLMLVVYNLGQNKPLINKKTVFELSSCFLPSPWRSERIGPTSHISIISGVQAFILRYHSNLGNTTLQIQPRRYNPSLGDTTLQIQPRWYNSSLRDTTLEIPWEINLGNTINPWKTQLWRYNHHAKEIQPWDTVTPWRYNPFLEIKSILINTLNPSLEDTTIGYNSSFGYKPWIY